MSTPPSSSTDDPPAYVPPTVWTWEIKEDNKFAAINQPTAGARFDRTLPVGKHPLQLYSMGTQNGQKVTIMLEELLEAGVQDAEYDAWLISILQKEQFGSEFVAVNPNSKVPAMMDYSDKDKSVRLFESGSILLYLADKFGHFLPADQRPEVMNWLFWRWWLWTLLPLRQ
jgi:GST-like protein